MKNDKIQHLKNYLKSECIFVYIIWTFLSIPVLICMALLFGLFPLIYSDFWKHIFCGTVIFESTFFIVTLLITLGNIHITKKQIKSSSIIFYSLCVSLLIFPLLDIDFEIVKETTLKDQLVDILNNGIGSLIAFILYCSIFWFRKEKCDNAV